MASFISTCSAVTNLFLGLNSGSIALYKIRWDAPPIGSQSVCVQYKVSGDPDWINASTNLSVDVNGNIASVLNIVTSPVANTTYDIQAFNQCGSLAFQTTFTYPESIFSGNFLVDYAVYVVCGGDPIVLYSNTAFAAGAVMYEDIELTTVLTGYYFIVSADSGFIYPIDPITGVVGAATAYSCRDTVANTVVLGNNSGTICSGTQTEVYSDGVAAIGSILYLDKALSVPVTGFDYILFIDNYSIFNLNAGTGEIGSDTGLGCTANGNMYRYSKVLNDIPSAAEVQLFTPGSFGKGAIMSTDFALTTPLTGYNYIALGGQIRTINSTTGEVGCLAVNC